MPASPSDLATTPLLSALLAVELVLLLCGCLILIRRIRGIPARFLGLAPAGLTPSPYRTSELFLAAAFAFGGAIILQVGATQIAERFFPKPADGSLGLYHILQGAGFQIGLLAGLAHAWFWHLRPAKRSRGFPALFHSVESASPDLSDSSPLPASAVPVGASPAETPRIPLFIALREGAGTFLTLLPIVWLTGFLWQKALDFLGVDAQPQDLVTLFAKTGDIPSLAIMIGLAVVVAPVTEELVFRIGLFRWLRTRIPRSFTLFLPAIAFASLHGNLAVLVPLVILAICLALAYERVGHPLVPIVAHALFNLNTLVLLLAGLPT